MATGSDATHGTGIYRTQGGNRLVVGSGGELDVLSGGQINVEAGGSITLPVVTETTATALANSGVSVVAATSAAGAQVFTIADPVAGAQKTINCTVANATDTCTILASTTVTFGNAGTSQNRYRFVLPGTVTMYGISSTRWAPLSSVSTTIAFATS